MAGNTKLLFSCSKEHPTLPRRELERNLSLELEELAPGWYVGEGKLPPSIEHFGYTKAVYEIIAKSAAEDYKEFASVIQDNYKLELWQEKNQFSGTVAFADTIHPHCQDKKVNLENPRHTYLFFFKNNNVFFCRLFLRQEDKAHLRRAHQRKHLHPTSLDPRLAKAMIALSGCRAFHDPFCGVGGIVLEGLRLEYEASGSDIAQHLVAQAKENALHEHLPPAFFIADATQLNHPSAAYISDLPFGKNSLLLQSKEELYSVFFSQVKKNTQLLVLGSDLPLQEIAEKQGWICEEEHEVYVHKSLTRKIAVYSSKR